MKYLSREEVYEIVEEYRNILTTEHHHNHKIVEDDYGITLSSGNTNVELSY